jgi:MFS family permease
MGISLSLGLVPTLAELIDILSSKGIYSSADISDLSVGIFNSMYSLGNLLAPLFGGVLSYYFAYSQVCEIIAFLSLGFAIAFYLTMVLNKTMRNHKKEALIVHQ